MERRQYLSVLISAGTVGLAGCTGTSDAIVSGSTNFEETWEVDLEEGDELELEVTLESGLFASGNISRMDNGDNVSTLETEEEGETLTDQFTVPETVDYFIVLQVEEGGDGSLALRHVEE